MYFLIGTSFSTLRVEIVDRETSVSRLTTSAWACVKCTTALRSLYSTRWLVTFSSFKVICSQWRRSGRGRGRGRGRTSRRRYRHRRRWNLNCIAFRLSRARTWELVICNGWLTICVHGGIGTTPKFFWKVTTHFSSNTFRPPNAPPSPGH